MKSIKTLCSSAAAVGLLIAVTCAGSASATVLCKTASAPCEAGNRYAAGTKIESHLKTGTRLIIDGAFGEALYECRESKLNLLTTTTGSAVATVSADTEAFTFGACEGTTPVVLKKPAMEIHWISGTNNGTITEQGIEITIVYLLSLDCVYGAPEAQAIGPLTGGKQAEIQLNLTLARIKGSGCPEELTWTALYEVTSPSPLYVTGS
jgi:hypothetical protein